MSNNEADMHERVIQGQDSDGDSVSSAEDSYSGGVDPDKYHLFGRQKPVHSALGGGKPADVLLWRNKQVSACLLASGTVIWLLFEWIGYHLLPFICHSLILAVATCFLWSNLSIFLKKSPVEFPNLAVSEELCNNLALLLRDRCNHAVCIFRDIATKKDMKKLLYAIGSLWIASVVGGWFDFLTLFYVVFVMLLTVPLLYEKNEDRVDSYAENAKSKLKKQYSKLDEKLLQKLPHIPFIKDGSKQQ